MRRIAAALALAIALFATACTPAEDGTAPGAAISQPGPDEAIINATSQAVLGANETRSILTYRWAPLNTYSGYAPNYREHHVLSTYNVGTGAKVQYLTIKEYKENILRHHYDCYSPYYPAISMDLANLTWLTDTYYTGPTTTLQCTCYDDTPIPGGYYCPGGNGSHHTAYVHVEVVAGTGPGCSFGTCEAWQYSNCPADQPNDGRVCRKGQVSRDLSYIYLDGVASYSCPTGTTSCSIPFVYQMRQ